MMETEFVKMCSEGNIEFAKNLIQENPNINLTEYGSIAFEKACFNGHLDVANWLIELNNDIIDNVDIGYMYGVCKNNHRTEICKFLEIYLPENRNTLKLLLRIQSLEDKMNEIIKTLQDLKENLAK